MPICSDDEALVFIKRGGTKFQRGCTYIGVSSLVAAVSVLSLGNLPLRTARPWYRSESVSVLGIMSELLFT